MKKVWDYNGKEYVIEKRGYGQYVLNGYYITDSEIWDWCVDDSNEDKHLEAMKMAEHYVDDKEETYHKEDFAKLYVWCFQYAYCQDIEEYQEG